MLYHFSDRSDIELFTPKTISYNTDIPPAVWAIDEEHSVNYFFPRDCPRIIYGRSPNVSAGDLEKFFAGSNAEKIITIDVSRKEQISNVEIYRYTFEDDGFFLKDRIAGYYISHNEVKPVKVEKMNDLAGKIEEAGAQLRYIEDLTILREAILSSTIDNFSMIRMKP